MEEYIPLVDAAAPGRKDTTTGSDYPKQPLSRTASGEMQLPGPSMPNPGICDL